MRNKFFISLFCLILAILSACTPVKIYSDSAMTKKSGLKVYTVKPYLKVERDAEKREIVKAELLYLPDLANPLYIGLKNGPGSRKVDIKLVDGCISTFGYSSDTKIDEYIDALSGLLSKGTYAVTNLDALKTPPASATVPNVVELYEIIMNEDSTTLREIIIGKE